MRQHGDARPLLVGPWSGAGFRLPPDEIEKLLESPLHEVRAGGLSIMDKQARRKRTSESRRKELFDL